MTRTSSDRDLITLAYRIFDMARTIENLERQKAELEQKVRELSGDT